MRKNLKRRLLEFRLAILEKNTLNLTGSAWKEFCTAAEMEQLYKDQEKIAKKKVLIKEKLANLK